MLYCEPRPLRFYRRSSTPACSRDDGSCGLLRFALVLMLLPALPCIARVALSIFFWMGVAHLVTCAVQGVASLIGCACSGCPASCRPSSCCSRKTSSSVGTETEETTIKKDISSMRSQHVNDEEVVVKIACPGIATADLNVTVDGDDYTMRTVRVSGETRVEKVLFVVDRSFRIPPRYEVVQDRVAHEDGELTIVLKRRALKKVVIPVTSAARQPAPAAAVDAETKDEEQEESTEAAPASDVWRTPRPRVYREQGRDAEGESSRPSDARGRGAGPAVG